MQHLLHPPKAVERRRFLSTGAVAAFAGCDRATVRRHIERGELEAIRLGANGDYRVPVDALSAWLRPAHDPEENTP